MKGSKGRKGKKGRKQSTRPEKQSWVQQTAQWRKDIFVSTGYSAAEILAGIKKAKVKDWMLKHVEAHQEDWKKLIDMNCAFVSCEEKHGALIIRLRPYRDSWDFWETLIHELSHAVDFIAERINIEKETEAKAYLQEFLFREIRRKLIGAQKYSDNGL